MLSSPLVTVPPPVDSSRENLFDGVAVVSATLVKVRENLGGRVNAWLEAHPELHVVDAVLTRPSDAAFHYVTITLSWRVEWRSVRACGR